MSIFQVEVVPVILEPHPNADSLSSVKVYGYTVCVNTVDWKDKKMGAYIPPDSVVPDNENFAFLQDKTRIKVRHLRGVVSMGLLVPAPAGSEIGQDVAEILGVTHYEPPLQNAKSSGESEASPIGIIAPKYDVENMLRFANLFQEEEPVYVTEKIHGANARYVWHDDRMWCGSKGEWKKQANDNLWWQALQQNPWIETYCRTHPGFVLYGEVFGNVQSLKYGAKPGHYQVRIFDILRDGQWLETAALFANKEIQTVPVLGVYPFNLKLLQEMAEGDSLLEGANHIREGIVVRPKIERITTEIGRLQLKLISDAYLEQ